MGVQARGLPRGLLAASSCSTNIRGALVTMPHKVTTVGLRGRGQPGRADRGRLQRRPAPPRRRRCSATCSTAKASCAACSARVADLRARARWSWAAAAWARRSRHRWPPPGWRAIGLFDANADAAARAGRSPPAALRRTRSAPPARNDPAGYDLVVNATPLGMNEGDPLPMDVSRIASSTFVGEVVMKNEMTAFLRAVQARGCRCPGRDRHAVRADSGVPRVLRPSDDRLRTRCAPLPG